MRVDGTTRGAAAQAGVQPDPGLLAAVAGELACRWRPPRDGHPNDPICHHQDMCWYEPRATLAAAGRVLAERLDGLAVIRRHAAADLTAVKSAHAQQLAREERKAQEAYESAAFFVRRLCGVAPAGSREAGE